MCPINTYWLIVFVIQTGREKRHQQVLDAVQSRMQTRATSALVKFVSQEDGNNN